jgi:hypothetical protein
VAKLRAAVKAKGEGDSSKRQVVLVPDGLSVGMLAGYSLPKAYKSFEVGKPDEWKMFAWFTLTHDRTNTQLKHFSSALLTIKCIVPEGGTEGAPKLYYDSESGFISGYVALLYAMLGGKLSQAEIARGEEDYDLDDFIGLPTILFTKRGKANKDGFITQKVQQLQPADGGVKKALFDLWSNKEVAVGENGLAYLKSPSPAYEDEVSGETSPEIEGEGQAYDDEDVVPF